VTTRTVIPSAQLAVWSPFVRVGETIATPRRRFSAHTHERQEVLIYLIEGAAGHSAGGGPPEDLEDGSVLFLTAISSVPHVVNPRPGRATRWFSVVTELPADSTGDGSRQIYRPTPTGVQPDGTNVTRLLGEGSMVRPRSGLEVTDVLFSEAGTAFRRVGPRHRSVFYALAGRGAVDNLPLEAGEAALVENSAAVSLSGNPGFRVIHATAPFLG